MALSKLAGPPKRPRSVMRFTASARLVVCASADRRTARTARFAAMGFARYHSCRATSMQQGKSDHGRSISWLWMTWPRLAGFERRAAAPTVATPPWVVPPGEEEGDRVRVRLDHPVDLGRVDASVLEDDGEVAIAGVRECPGRDHDRAAAEVLQRLDPRLRPDLDTARVQGGEDDQALAGFQELRDVERGEGDIDVDASAGQLLAAEDLDAGEGFLLEERFGRHDRVIAGQRAKPDRGRLRRRERRGLSAEDCGQIGSQQPPARDRGGGRGGPGEGLASCEHISPLPLVPSSLS